MMNKLMKKMAIVLTVAAMAIAGTATIASANDTRYVSYEIGLNVREGASAETSRLGGLNKGEAVDVVADLGNGWSQINFNGKKGFVLTEGLAANGCATHDADQSWITFTNSSHTAREQAERGWMSHDNDTFTVGVESGFLALRSSAYSSSDNIVGELYNGQMVQVKEYGTQFDWVYAPSLDMYGYVNNDYLF